MLRALLVRAAGATLAAAIAISCSHDEPPAEKLGQLQQHAVVGGAGGAAEPPAAAGAPTSDGGAPLVGTPGDGGAGGDASPPYVCGQNDCQGACQVCIANVCVPRPITHECRAASGGECDAPEFCDGVSAECPTEEKYKDAGTSCGALPVGDCDAPDTCTGSSKSCPDDVKDVGVVCRAATDLCDVEDTCNGTSKTCADRVQDAGVSCRSSTDLCDVEDTCNGTSKVCSDKVQSRGFACRGSAGDCDLPDSCDGASKICVDAKQGPSHTCRASSDVCDSEDRCDGVSNDCKDTFKPATLPCRASLDGSDSCDPPEYCTGTAAACPMDVRLPNQTDCKASSANKCATAAACENGLCVVSQEKACRPADDCRKAEVCNRSTGACEVEFEPDDTACSDGIVCSTGDRCVKGVCTPQGVDPKLCTQRACAAVFCDLSATTIADRCRYDPTTVANRPCREAVSVCDIAERCDGVSYDCPSEDKHQPVGTECKKADCSGNQAQPRVLCDGSAYCPVVPSVSCDGYACDDAKACKNSCDTSADCIPSYYCLDHVCEKRVDPGKACESDAECPAGSAFCVDGVCCNTACKGQCEACNLPGTEGTCSLVTGDPVGDRAPCRGDGSICHGSCDGTKRGQCVFPATTTTCRDAACDPETGAAVEQAFCDGAGSCAATEPNDCAPYVCGATACRGDCVTDAQCAGDHYCKAAKCTPLEEPGTACARDAQCASGFCTDGVCCDGRCDGQCEACGKTGECEAVTGEPVGKRAGCAGEEGDPCAGACDGQNRQSCSYPGAVVVCREAACDSSVATVAAHCAGDGRCAEAQTVDCPNGCEGTLCAGDACAVSADCKAGERCLAGACAPLGDDGASCSSAADCGSGFCVDGVCCDRACDGQCEACDGRAPGVCAPVSGAPRGNRPACTSDGSVCGGACDGENAFGCAYPTGTVCAAGACQPAADGNEAVATTESQCNGSGRCPAQRQQACGPEGCADDDLCEGDCADGSACPRGKFCSAGVCVEDLPDGEACQASDQCASGHCVDGYCCGSACDDTCAACDVPGQLGKCVPVTGATHGGRNACRGGGACGSACDGKNVSDCVFAGEDVSCSEPYCRAGVKVDGSVCDGAGQCRAGASEVCPAQACGDGGECSAACTTDADCTRSLQCREGKCVDPFVIHAVDEGTCGCRAPGSASSRSGAWLGAVLLVALGARRRRPRKAA